MTHLAKLPFPRVVRLSRKTKFSEKFSNKPGILKNAMGDSTSN